MPIRTSIPYLSPLERCLTPRSSLPIRPPKRPKPPSPPSILTENPTQVLHQISQHAMAALVFVKRRLPCRQVIFRAILLVTQEPSFSGLIAHGCCRRRESPEGRGGGCPPSQGENFANTLPISSVIRKISLSLSSAIIVCGLLMVNIYALRWFSPITNPSTT